MHYAAEREDVEMVKVLLKNGAVWNAGTSSRSLLARLDVGSDAKELRYSLAKTQMAVELLP